MNSYNSKSVQILNTNKMQQQQQRPDWKSQESFKSRKQYIENCLVRNNLHQIRQSQDKIESNSPTKSIYSSQSLSNYYYSSHSTINSTHSESQESIKSRRVTEILRKLAKNLDSNEIEISLTQSSTNLSQTSFQVPKNHSQLLDKSSLLVSIIEDATHEKTPKNSTSDLTSTQKVSLLKELINNEMNESFDNIKKSEINEINENRKDNTIETNKKNNYDLLNTFETLKGKKESFELEDEIINGAFAPIFDECINDTSSQIHEMKQAELSEEENSPRTTRKLSRNSKTTNSLSSNKKIDHCSRENSILLDTILGTSPMIGLQYDTEQYLDRQSPEKLSENLETKIRNLSVENSIETKKSSLSTLPDVNFNRLYIEDEKPRRFASTNIYSKIENKKQSNKGALKKLFKIKRQSKRYSTNQDAFSETDERPSGCKIN